VPPGTYTMTLTVDGQKYSKPIVVKQDPRVTTPAATMQQVYSWTDALYFGALDAHAAAEWDVRNALAGLMNSMQAADVAPTANTRAAVEGALKKAREVLARVKK
jgi:hypothetical protein